MKVEEASLVNGVPGWITSHKTGDVQALHSLENMDWSLPALWVMAPTNSSLVLGSSQDDACIDYEYAEKIDVGIARRRTGGGAVFVDPQTLFWVDFRRHCVCFGQRHPGLDAYAERFRSHSIYTFGIRRLARCLARFGRFVWSNIHHHRREPTPEKTLGYLALTLLHECTANVP